MPIIINVAAKAPEPVRPPAIVQTVNRNVPAPKPPPGRLAKQDQAFCRQSRALHDLWLTTAP